LALPEGIPLRYPVLEIKEGALLACRLDVKGRVPNRLVQFQLVAPAATAFATPTTSTNTTISNRVDGVEAHVRPLLRRQTHLNGIESAGVESAEKLATRRHQLGPKHQRRHSVGEGKTGPINNGTRVIITIITYITINVIIATAGTSGYPGWSCCARATAAKVIVRSMTAAIITITAIAITIAISIAISSQSHASLSPFSPTPTHSSPTEIKGLAHACVLLTPCHHLQKVLAFKKPLDVQQRLDSIRRELQNGAARGSQNVVHGIQES